MPPGGDHPRVAAPRAISQNPAEVTRSPATPLIVSLSPKTSQAITIVTGGVLGLLFTVFLGENDGEDDNQSFLAMVGIIALACGAAYFLNLTPLLVNLVLGLVLVNTSRVGGQIRESLTSSSKPLTLLLLIFALHMKRLKMLRAFPLAAVLHVPYVILFGALGQFVKFHWKDKPNK